MPAVILPVPFRDGGNDAILYLELFEEDGAVVCGLRNLEGVVAVSPKAMLRHLKWIEDLAREGGATEMRHAGKRSLAKILRDYEPDPDLPNGLRKRLQ